MKGSSSLSRRLKAMELNQIWKAGSIDISVGNCELNLIQNVGSVGSLQENICMSGRSSCYGIICSQVSSSSLLISEGCTHIIYSFIYFLKRSHLIGPTTNIFGKWGTPPTQKQKYASLPKIEVCFVMPLTPPLPYKLQYLTFCRINALLHILLAWVQNSSAKFLFRVPGKHVSICQILTNHGKNGLNLPDFEEFFFQIASFL